MRLRATQRTRLRNQRVQPQRRRDQVAHARVARRCRRRQRGDVFLPVPPRRQEVWADNNGAGAVCNARVKRVGDGGRRLRTCAASAAPQRLAGGLHARTSSMCAACTTARPVCALYASTSRSCAAPVSREAQLALANGYAPAGRWTRPCATRGPPARRPRRRRQPMLRPEPRAPVDARRAVRLLSRGAAAHWRAQAQCLVAATKRRLCRRVTSGLAPAPCDSDVHAVRSEAAGLWAARTRRRTKRGRLRVCRPGFLPAAGTTLLCAGSPRATRPAGGSAAAAGPGPHAACGRVRLLSLRAAAAHRKLRWRPPPATTTG